MIKKMFCVCLTTLILVNATMASAYSDPVANSDYKRYNIATGEATYHSIDNDQKASQSGETRLAKAGYFPNAGNDLNVQDMINTGGLISPSAIVGADNRTVVTNTTVTPYSCTVYIHSVFAGGTSKKASAFMIGPAAVVTAAHCVFHEGQLATSITVTPAKNGNINPFGSATISSVADHVVTSPLYDSTMPWSPEEDWAVIELPTAIGEQSGWFGMVTQEETFAGTIVYNTGYPSSSTCANQNSSGTLMMHGYGTIMESTEYYLNGAFDASSGNSGGPVYIVDPEMGYCVIGILTGGAGENGDQYPNAYSTVTRITQDLYDIFNIFAT